MLRSDYRPKRPSASAALTELDVGDNACSDPRQLDQGELAQKETNSINKQEDEEEHDDEDKSPSAGVQQNEDDVDKLVNSMSALKFVPPSIRFGRGGRGGFAKR